MTVTISTVQITTVFSTNLCTVVESILSVPVYPQDDSDDEPPASKRTHGRSDTVDFIDFSCEEGEETASSEGHSEVSCVWLSFDFEEKCQLLAPEVFFWMWVGF